VSLRARLTLFFVAIVVLPVAGVRLTVSIGVACFPEHPTSREELLRAADEALYEAKLQGRDRVVIACPRLLPLAARPGPVKGRAARVE
jgi:diguanylate cyclase (GGDEF)-like protein